jgi:hypothetical protein
VPVQLADLTNLELAQFHGNWLNGDIHHGSHLLKDPSSFTSDCGMPSAFDKPTTCKNCTMCCNLLGQCHTTELPVVLNEDIFWGFRNYVQFGIVLLLFIFGFFVILVLATYFLNKHSWTRSVTKSVSQELIEEEKKDALKIMGHGTVYWFFLTRYWTAWIVALSVIVFQFLVYGFFVNAAEKKFDDEKVVSLLPLSLLLITSRAHNTHALPYPKDFVYAWRCPRNNMECESKDDTTSECS